MPQEAQTYARVQGDTVAEIVVLPAGSPPLASVYHPTIAQQMHALTEAQAETVQVGWLYVDGDFEAPPPPEAPDVIYIPVPLARERLEADGFWDEFSAILASEPAAMLKVLTLRDGIDPSDPVAIALIGGSGADPARILAPPGTVLPPLDP